MTVHVVTLTPAAIKRPNRNMGHALDGGAPTTSIVAHLEGHIEEFLGEEDDVVCLQRGAHVDHLIATAAEQVERDLLTVGAGHGTDYDIAILQRSIEIQRRIIRCSTKVSKELGRRAARLKNVVIPAVRECYLHAESLHEKVRH